MPITPSPTAATSGGGLPAFNAASSGNSGMPFGLSLPGYQFNTPSANMAPNFQSIMSLLTQQPASMTNSVMPGLESILGLQTQSMMPYFQNQTSQMVSGAQSDAQARGMTGSSIEAANMTGARAAGAQNMNQWMAQQLGTLGQAYTGAVGQDVGTQNQMYQNVAQALGQQMQSQIQQQQFQQQIQAMNDQARMSGQYGLWGSLIGAGGMAAGGALMACDARLKTNITPLYREKGLTVYAFDYRKDAPMPLPEGRRIGFMAQDVEKRFPGCVTEVQGFKAIKVAELNKALQEA